MTERKKHAGGRPKIWTPERIAEEGRALLAWMQEDGTRYWLKGYAIEHGYPAQNLSEWAADPSANPEFSEAYKQAKDIQEQRLVTLGMTMRTPTMVLFALKNVAGWRDAQAVEHSGPDGKAIQHEHALVAAQEFDALLERTASRRTAGPEERKSSDEGGSAV